MREGTRTLLLDERQAAAALGLTPRCLQNWRINGTPDGGDPLPHVRISSRCIRYRAEDIERFAAQRLRVNTSDDGSAAQAGPRVVEGGR